MLKFFFLVVLVISITSIKTPSCELSVGMFKNLLKRPQNSLVNQFPNVCSFLPTSFQVSCKEYLEKNGKSSLENLQNMDPFELCQKISSKEPKVTELVIKTIQALQSKDCGVTQLREYYYFLPPSWKEEVKNQLLLVISMQLSRIDFQVVEKFVKELFDDKYPAERVCADIDRIFLPEWNRRQNCTNVCMDKVDLSPARILKVVLKCKLELECYWLEIQDELMNVQACSDECYAKPDQVLIK